MAMAPSLRADYYATRLRRKFCRDMQETYLEIERCQKAAITQKNRERQAFLIKKERLRKERHAQRMAAAQEWREMALLIISGWKYKFYSTPEAAREARKLYKRAWSTLYAKTPKGMALSREADSRKRAEKAIRCSRPPGVSEFYLQILTQPQTCFWCRKPLAPGEAVGDHFVPLACGGKHSADNLVPACSECNNRKADQLPLEFISNL